MTWLLGGIVVYLVITGSIAWLFLHPIRTPVFISPGAMGAAQENIELLSRGQLIRGWWMAAPGATSVMVLSHGYMMNRSEVVPTAVQLWEQGVSCLLFDFPAHGKSQGRKCFLGTQESYDVEAAVAYA